MAGILLNKYLQVIFEWFCNHVDFWEYINKFHFKFENIVAYIAGYWRK